MVPLFGAVPGGPEMLIIFVVMLFMMGIPLILLAGVFLLGRWSASRGSDVSEEQVAALQERVDELEAKLAAVRGDTETEGETTADLDSRPDRSP